MPVVRRRAEALERQADRLGAELGPGQPAVVAMHRAEPGEHARHRHRERAGARDTGGVALGSRGAGRGAGAVEHDGAAALRVEHMVEAVAAEPRHRRLDDGQSERSCDRRIDGVAAGAQRQKAGLCRERVVRRDGAAPADDQGPITADFLGHAGSVARCNANSLAQRTRWARKGRDAHQQFRPFRRLCVSIAAIASKRYLVPMGKELNKNPSQSVSRRKPGPTDPRLVPLTSGSRLLPGRVVGVALLLSLCLAAAGCTSSDSSSDDNRRGGFYGGVSGGMSHP